MSNVNFFTNPSRQATRRTQGSPFAWKTETIGAAGNMLKEGLHWVSKEKWDLRSLPQSLHAFQDWGHLPILHPTIVTTITIILPLSIRSIDRRIELSSDPLSPSSGVTLRQVMVALHKAMTAEITPDDLQKIAEDGALEMCQFAMEQRGEISNGGDGSRFIMRYCDTTWIDWAIIVKSLERPYQGPNNTRPWEVDYICE
ncbi:hypothetical protein D9619_012864 [Psilocybe cf. subviscida]|uniref:Uncharacterized protein n=1 Tax=Psilocybe cf. subviscida TaxID=2480587 RepID=A0A8H5BI44_9AGAR|nr:hypothetical protein D9619_012864 [Psilocybe cf. subviscida]